VSRRDGRDDLLLVLHELRNPLIGIDAAARVLATELNGHSTTGRARAIAAEARHLLQLLESVSEAEAAASGRLRSTLRPLDLRAVVRETAASFQRGREIVVSCPSDAVIVKADAGRIRQVLANLLANAAQYSPAESPIEVSLRATDRQATVSVRDRGPGIPPRERRQLFRKFARLSTAEATRGSGLGLYICKAIVADHGGTIGYREKTFSFTLPLGVRQGAKRRPRAGDVVRRPTRSRPKRGGAR
jgi:signal transduction histidine kinase